MPALNNIAYQLTQDNHEWTIAVVRKLIRNSHLKISELEELKSAGVYGLIEAAQRYRPGESCQFRSFAYKRIHGALIDHVRRNTKDSRQIFQRQKRDITPKWKTRKPNKPDRPNNLEHISEAVMSNWLLYTQAQSPEDVSSKLEVRQLIQEILKKLPTRQRELILRHYYDGEEFKKIGRSWNKNSKSWLSKLHHQVLDQLKDELSAAGYQHS